MGWSALRCESCRVGSAPAGEGERSFSLADHLTKQPPRIAARAVGRELVVVFMESGDAAEVDHAETFAGGRLRR
jgi:hypothetical protein